VQIDQSATVLVTGATGFLGRALVKTLGEHACNLRLFARPGTDAHSLAEKYGARIIEGELSSPSTVLEACADTTHIFHLAGQQASSKQNRINAKAAMYASNVASTRVLAECAAQQPRPPRFIQVSSVAVHGDTGDKPATETSEFRTQTDYEKSKLEAELVLREVAGLSNLPITILRPCAIVGPEDHRLLKLFRLANRRLIPILGKGDNRYQIIHVDDMANVLVTAAQSRQAIGETYVCGNAETLKLRELIELIASLAAKDRRSAGRILSIPRRPVVAAVQGLEKICAKLGITAPLSTDRLGFFSANHWFDTSKLSELLENKVLMHNHLQKEDGTQPGRRLITHSNASAVADAQRWYEDQRLL